MESVLHIEPITRDRSTENFARRLRQYTQMALGVWLLDPINAIGYIASSAGRHWVSHCISLKTHKCLLALFPLSAILLAQPDCALNCVMQMEPKNV
jgi:hypothetical protein